MASFGYRIQELRQGHGMDIQGDVPAQDCLRIQFSRPCRYGDEGAPDHPTKRYGPDYGCFNMIDPPFF